MPKIEVLKNGYFEVEVETAGGDTARAVIDAGQVTGICEEPANQCEIILPNWHAIANHGYREVFAAACDAIDKYRRDLKKA